MSLLSAAYEKFVMMDKSTVPDGVGGIARAWTEGAEFEATAMLDTSTTARVGVVQGLTSVYTVTTPRSVNLQKFEVFKRLSDGKIFRATSDGDDKKTPAAATLDMRQVSAEEYALTV